MRVYVLARVRACARVCVRAYVCVCVRARVLARVCMCACMHVYAVHVTAIVNRTASAFLCCCHYQPLRSGRGRGRGGTGRFRTGG